MKLFGGTTPQEKAISILIHDHCGAQALIGSYINLAKRYLEGNDIPKALEMLDGAKKGVTRHKEVLDTYIEKAKNDFNN